MDMFEVVEGNIGRVFLPERVVFRGDKDLCHAYVRMRGIISITHIERSDTSRMGFWVYGEIAGCFLDMD